MADTPDRGDAAIDTIRRLLVMLDQAAENGQAYVSASEIRELLLTADPGGWR